MIRGLTRLAIVLTLVPVSVSQAPADPGAVPGLVVHEWGTFTSIAGKDGTAVEWAPQAGPQDLPCFVDRLWANIKGLIPGTVRMETPVVYFYAPRDLTVNVSVRFRQGVVTEWYPSAAVSPSGVGGVDLRSPAFQSSITWRRVRIAPGSAPDFPADAGPSHYYAARETDASPIESSGEMEKFLFYRGVGGFQPPLSAELDPEGGIVVASPAGEPIGDVILFENRGGAIAYELRQTTESRETFDPLTPAVGAFPPFVELERILTSHGLYPKEAAAMIETWRDSWFEEGTRLLYIAPRKMVDAILPLAVTPAPAAVERVFVGRIELITPSTETDVRDAIARDDAEALRKYGRFAVAIVGELLAGGTSAEPARARALLRALSPSWTPPPASCNR